MVSQNQDAEWSDHPPVRSGSMLSLDGRQRPQVARTPPSYYDAVRSRHSLSHPVGRQQEPSKQDKQYFPPHEKYNSLPRPLPQRYAVAMTNGHDKFQAPHGSPWAGSPPQPPNTNGGWNPVLTDGVSPSLPRSERPPRPQQEPPHEYRSPPGPANPVPQVHLPSWSREAPPSHLSTGVFPGQYNNSSSQHEQPISPPYKHSSAPVDDGQQYSSHFGDVRSPPNHFSLQNSLHRRHPPTGPRQHPPPPPIPSQQRQHPPHQPQTVASPTNGTVEMRRPNPDRRDTDGTMHTGRWMRRSYPSTSEDMSAQEIQYSRSHSQELSHSHNQTYDPRYSRSGTLPARPRSHGADIVLPAPAVSMRTGPLGTYPESRPTHMDHLPPPSSPQPSSLPEMSNSLSPRERNGTKQPRSPYSEKEGLSKGHVEPKGHQHQPSLMTLNDALLFPNGLSLRKSMSSSTASLCSETSSASSRARRTQSRSNGETPIKRVPLNSRSKGAINESHTHGKKDKDSVISPSPWAREEKEKLQKRQVQDARRARDEEIAYLESLPDRTHKQDEILRILRLEREFQKRAEEVANGDDDEDDEEDEILDRAEHMERMLRMQEETARSRSKQGNSTDSHQQHTAANSSDDWLARRKMNHLSRIMEENSDFHRDLHIQNGADVEQLSEFLDNLSMQTKREDSPPNRQDLLDHQRTNDEIRAEAINGYSGQQDIKMGSTYEANNVLNANNDRTFSFPVPAPRTSKTHIPPPVPPKSKTQSDSNGYMKTDDPASSPESTPTTGYIARDIRYSSKMESSPVQEGTMLQRITEPKSPVSQTINNGFDSSTTVNGLVKTERAREVDIANLYASSKMRNGFTDSRPELEKSPEMQKLWTSRPEKLTFQDKIRKFSLQAGEEEVPRDKVKNSRAQREIEIKFNEGLSKNATQET